MNYLYTTIEAFGPAINDYMLPTAKGLLFGVALLMFLNATIQSAILGSAHNIYSWLFKVLFITVVLSSYNDIVLFAVGVADELGSFFLGKTQTPAEVFAASIDAMDNLQQESSFTDRMLGVLKASPVSMAYSVSFFLVTLAFDMMQDLASMVLGILYAFGPLLMVADILPGIGTAKTWFISLVHVLLWPVVPLLLLFVADQALITEAARSNTAVVIGQNIVYSMAAIFSPLMVALLVGKSGIGTAGAAVTAFALKGGATLASSFSSGAQSAYSKWQTGEGGGYLPGHLGPKAPQAAAGGAGVIQRPDRMFLTSGNQPKGLLTAPSQAGQPKQLSAPCTRFTIVTPSDRQNPSRPSAKSHYQSPSKQQQGSKKC